MTKLNKFKVKTVSWIGGIATVSLVIPAIVMVCNTNNPNPDPEEYTPLDQPGEFSGFKYLKSKNLNFNSSTTYKIKFSWGDAVKYGCKDEASGWAIMCGRFDDESSDINDFVTTPFSAYVNGEPLGVGDVTAKDSVICPSKKLNLNNNDEIEIEFMLLSTKIRSTTGYVLVMSGQ